MLICLYYYISFKMPRSFLIKKQKSFGESSCGVKRPWVNENDDSYSKFSVGAFDLSKNSKIWEKAHVPVSQVVRPSAIRPVQHLAKVPSPPPAVTLIQAPSKIKNEERYSPAIHPGMFTSSIPLEPLNPNTARSWNYQQTYAPFNYPFYRSNASPPIHHPVPLRFENFETKPQIWISDSKSEISLIRTVVSPKEDSSSSSDSSSSASSKAKAVGRHQCPDCSKSYSTNSGLSKHRQSHCLTSQNKKCIICKYCEKEYMSLGALKMHIRTHTLPCKCKICGKAFSRPWLLQGHIRTHTGERPFSCTHCSRAFADRSNLRAHLQTHSDVKKYSCKICLKTFSRMSLMLKHENSGSCLASGSNHSL